MLKVAVVTGSRADYWLLRPLLLKLKLSGYLNLIITGEHLKESSKIKVDNFIVDKEVECLSTEDNYVSLVKAISRGVSNFADALCEIKPDMLVLLGDRYETFAAATASYSLKIPIAHIHGGEVTYGALDDGFRHSISKMANLHFVSHEEYKKRLLRMGEEPEKVHTVGAIGLDNLSQVKFDDRDLLFKQYPFLSQKNYFLLALHPSTLSKGNIENQAEAIITALESFSEYNIVVTQSNSDPDGSFLNKKWQNWANNNKNVYFIPTLGDNYLKVAYFSKMVIGNSSSGILEIPYLNRPVLNLGERQKGRIMPKGVYCVEGNSDKIILMIESIFDTYIESEKIYGIPGKVSESIFNIIKNFSKHNLNDLIYKKFYDAK